MKIMTGRGTTDFGPGVDILLTGDEVATAIHAFLIAHGVYIDGPRTVKVNDDLCSSGMVHVDPCGFVFFDGEKINGRG